MPDDDDLDWYELELSTSLSVAEDEEHAFVTCVEGRVMRCRERGEPIEVGQTRSYLIDFVRAELTTGESLACLLDEEATTAQYLGVIGPGGVLSDELEGRFPFVDRLLLIDKVVLLPRYRGHRLGLWVVYRILDIFGNANTLPLLIPYPLQFSGGYEEDEGDSLELEAYGLGRAEAFMKLRSHWRKVGFEKYSDLGEYEIWLLDPEAKQPERSSVLAGSAIELLSI